MSMDQEEKFLLAAIAAESAQGMTNIASLNVGGGTGTAQPLNPRELLPREVFAPPSGHMRPSPPSAPPPHFTGQHITASPAPAPISVPVSPVSQIEINAIIGQLQLQSLQIKQLQEKIDALTAILQNHTTAHQEVLEGINKSLTSNVSKIRITLERDENQTK